MTTKQQEDLKMLAMYHVKDQIFYFDEQGIYRAMNVEEALKDSDVKVIGFHLRKDGSFYIRTPSPHECGCDNGRVLIMALSRMREGDTMARFEELLATCRPLPPNSHVVEGIDRFICKIDRPVFCRKPENENEKTFDYIYIDVSVVGEQFMKGRDEYLKAHVKEITKKVVDKLQKTPTFQKYGVPIQFLKIGRLTFKKNVSLLEYVFELKIDSLE